MNRLFYKVTRLSKSEIPFALAMGLQFFFIIGVFWILKPLKKTLFIQHYDKQPFHFWGGTFDAAQAELFAKNINMLVAMFAMALFILLAKRLKKQLLVAFFAASLIVGAVAVMLWLQLHNASSVWALYIFGDLFNMLMVASFFAFLNDSVSPDQAKRLFGIVVLGGVAGGAVGSTLTKQLFGSMSVNHWILICIAIMFLIVCLAFFASNILKRNQGAFTACASASPQPSEATFSLKQLLRSKYILSIAAMVGCYEIVSSIVDFQFSAAASHYLDGDAIGNYFSTIYMTVNIVSLSVQVLVTSWVMTRLGITHALMFLPVSLLLGSLTFLAAPLLIISAFLCIFDNGLNYSINQSAKESLYVPIHSNGKYNAKALVDIFTQRTAKAISVNLTLVLSALLSFRWLALISMCFIVLWITAAFYAGRQFDNKENQQRPWQKKERKNRFLKKPKLFPIAHLRP